MATKFLSKIFTDGGDPQETQAAKELLGYLDGQTTNPTLIAKNLAKTRLGTKLTQEKAVGEYQRIVREISQIIPQGSVSIQVFANNDTKSEEMLVQARDRTKWIPNSSIKLPCTLTGLRTAEIVCREMPINITLVFSQSQAAAVYEATKNAQYPVFISPFVGRLDDLGQDGMQVVANILQMYADSDHHVEVVTASVRNLDHIYYGLQLGSDIITIPFKVMKEWAETGFMQPGADYLYQQQDLKEIPFRNDVVLGKPWQEYDLAHELTDKGVATFWSDWMGLFE